MKIQQLLDHYRMSRNPFSEEDAQTDLVFKDHCINGTHHPAWDKIYGDPKEPATSIVFGEKGSGKTALRLQVAHHLQEYNRQHQGERLFVIHFDDFNHFLDRFRDKLGGRRKRIERALAEWRLWDHMDAILTLGITGLIDRILAVAHPSDHTPGHVDAAAANRLDRHQCRDLLLLAACYDQSTAETVLGRWHRLRRKLRFWTTGSYWQFALGILATLTVATIVTALMVNGQWVWVQRYWLYLIVLLAGWTPWLRRAWQRFWLARGIVKQVRVGNLDSRSLRRILGHFTCGELSGQPLPCKPRTDDRYELLTKFQGILKTIGFSGMVVLVDRIDEPHLINGSANLMKALLWPLLDNKFLKQPGLGLKLLLPIELTQFIDREEREFYERARLDKQNMIPSLEWTGEALYDIANDRMKACSQNGEVPSLLDLFDNSVTEQHIIDSFRNLRVPRHLFKFLYRLLVTHSGAHTDQDPCWKISRETFESVLAVFMREQDALDRGLTVR